MKIFLDSANVASIKTFADMGILDGVTTNPTLIAKENLGFLELVGEILRIVSGPVNLEVVSQNIEGMLHEAHDLAALAPNVVVKVPMTSEGLVAVRKLHKEGIKTNVTLVFSPNQALLAAKAGAGYVSPFIGRLDDAGHVVMRVVEEIWLMVRNYGIKIQDLVGVIVVPHYVDTQCDVWVHSASV